MNNAIPGSAARELAWAVGGAAVVGACLGARLGPQASLALTLSVPAALIGVAGVTAPALYIGATFAGVAPAPSALFAALHQGLGDAGRMLVGLAPVLVLLTATATSTATVTGLGRLAMLVAVATALRLSWPRVFATTTNLRRAALLFGAWSIVALGIGHHLLADALARAAG